eukprot:m.82393 g.82393  ORF g.82393 m.82393 type:complete len:208 (-) comp14293_c0_seq4:2249-2872(-)
MGSWTSSLWQFNQQPARVLLLGLDAAGKTTLLYKMKLGEVETVIPTIGLCIEKLNTKAVQFTSLDMGGRCPVRPLWRFYAEQIDALVLVVDAADSERLEHVHNDFAFVLKISPADVPVLIFANKMDLPTAQSIQTISEQLQLQQLLGSSRQWHVQASSFTTDAGIVEGLQWLDRALNGAIPTKSTKAFHSGVVKAVQAKLKTWHPFP